VKVDRSPLSEGIVRFRVEGVSGRVTQAKLRLYASNGSPNGPALYPVPSGWSESLVTWDTKPALTGPMAANVGQAPAKAWVEYDVTSLVAGDGIYSFGLVAESSDSVEFASRESSSPNKPQLVLTTEQAGPVGPETTIDSGPSEASTSSSASFSFSSSDPSASFECRLDGGELGSGAFTPCDSPKLYIGLAFGSHVFEVRALDAAGTPDPTPAKRHWTVGLTTTSSFGVEADTYVDPAAPGVNFASGPLIVVDRSPLSEGFVRLRVEGVTGVIRQAKLRLYASNGTSNGPALLPTTSDWSESLVTWDNKPAATGPAAANVGQVASKSWVEYDVTSALAGDGVYSFALVPESSDGIDLVSRESTSANKPQLVITSDRPAPETVIDSGPSRPTKSSEATFEFSASEPGATFECRLDGGEWEGCASPKQYTGLGEGHHDFEVRAIADGAPDRSPASRGWAVDNTPPTISSRSPLADAADVLPGATVEVRYSEEMDPDTVTAAAATLRPSGESTPVAARVSYEAATQTVTLAPEATLDDRTTYVATVTGGPDGARDLAGNPMAADEAWSFTTATVYPETTVESGPIGVSANTGATFVFSSEPGATFECRLDGGAWDACTSPVEYTGLAEGPHSFEVKATGADGDPDDTPASRTWTVDPVAQPLRGPQVPATGAYLGAYVDGDALDAQSRSEVTDFEAMIGRALRIGHHYRPWNSRFILTSGERSDEGWDVDNGRIPMISHSDTEYEGTVNILDAINSGSQDEQIRSQARQVRDFGHPLFYRPLREMNGDWESYNETFASTPGTHDGTEKFVAAWRRIHTIWGEEGATNAAFVWCPNAIDKPRTAENHWTLYYPGDEYVDWVCADGYNRGAEESWSDWRSFADLFAGIYADYPDKPFMIGETSAAESGGDKAQWIRDAQTEMKTSMTRIKAFVWFHRGVDTSGSTDWRVDSSPASLDAYRALAADPYFGP
jgi:Bacterial Ig-like domain/Glycosyl hydrolase family 26